MHPISGDLSVYQKLIEVLDLEISVFGIQPIGYSNPELVQNSVEEMARSYIEKIKSIQKNGPYFLLGWSFGGCLAFEIALQLQNFGLGLSKLILLDSHTGGKLRDELDDFSKAFSLARTLTHIRNKKNDIKGIFDFVLKKEWHQLSFEEKNAVVNHLNLTSHATYNNYSELSYGFYNYLKSSNFYLLKDMSFEHYLKLTNVLYGNVIALNTYQPGGMFNGNATVLYCEDDEVPLYNRSAAWSQHICGNIEMHMLQGTHETMLEVPIVSQISKFLQTVLVEKFT